MLELRAVLHVRTFGTPSHGTPSSRTPDELVPVLRASGRRSISSGIRLHAGPPPRSPMSDPGSRRRFSPTVSTTQLTGSTPPWIPGTLDMMLTDSQPCAEHKPPSSARRGLRERDRPCRSTSRQESDRETPSAGAACCTRWRSSRRSGGESTRNQGHSEIATDV